MKPFWFLLFMLLPVHTLHAAAIIQSQVIKFSCQHSEADIQATGAQALMLGQDRLYIGTRQVSSINQNPIVRRFGAVNWCREDYETTGADGRGMGMLWDNGRLYGVFTTDGTQGDSSEDYRRFTAHGWLRSYGSGGGAKVAVVVELNPATGEGLHGSFISAILSSGNTNSLAVKDLCFNSAGNVLIRANAWYSPRQPDKKALDNISAASSPHDYSLELSADLSRAVASSAPGWDGGGIPNGMPLSPGGCSVHPFPFAYNGMGFTLNYQPMTTSSHFVSRIESGGQSYTHSATLNAAQNMTIQSTMQIDARHQGQAARLFVIALYQNLFLTRHGQVWQTWTGALTELGSAENRTALASEESLTLFSGSLPGLSGQLTLLNGYQLADGRAFVNLYQPTVLELR